nr:IS1634 family transposase [Sulfobacillus thermosulfidooxidans]
MSNILFMKLVELPSRVVGAAPVIRGIADAIGFVDLLNTLLVWDAQQCRTSPGERILAMVLDILTGKSPLYRVPDRLAETDVPLLLGRGRTAADFTDDALGRALDKLFQAGPAAVFTAVAAQAYAREAIELRSGHWDSTSRSLQGAYRSAEDDTEPCDPTAVDDAAVPPRAMPRRGHSKDRRPDLKQVLLTVFVNGEGVLRFGSVASGNTSDKTLNRRMIEELVAAFSPQELHDVIYVADSSLVTKPNLAGLRQANLRFISRCPSTFAVAQTAKETAWAQDAWTFLGSVAARRDAAEYWASEQQAMIDDVPYRLVVYRSSRLETHKEKTLDQQIANARKALADAAHVLSQTLYDCREDAAQAARQWQARRETAWFAVETTLHEEVQRLPR